MTTVEFLIEVLLPAYGFLLAFASLFTFPHFIWIYPEIKKGKCPHCGGKIKRGWIFNGLTRFYCDNKYVNNCKFEYDFVPVLAAMLIELVSKKRHNTTFDE